MFSLRLATTLQIGESLRGFIAVGEKKRPIGTAWAEAPDYSKSPQPPGANATNNKKERFDRLLMKTKTPNFVSIEKLSTRFSHLGQSPANWLP